MLLCWRSLGFILSNFTTALTPLCQRYFCSALAVRSKYTMEPGKVDARLGYEGRQPSDKIQGFEDHLGRTIAPRGL